MSLSIQQMRSPFTRQEALDLALLVLQDLGFDTTGWQDGRIQKTELYALATIASDLSEIVKSLVEFTFNDYATGDPLNEFSKSRFDNEKTPAVATQGPITLRNSATIPYAIQVGQLIVGTDTGVQYRNLTGGTIPAGGSVDLNFQALHAGLAGNVPAAQITRLVTSLAGVTVSASGNPWYSIAGKDEEADASIKRRNSTKWSTLSVELVGEAYENIARTAGAAKVALEDNNPRGPGTIDVYVAGATGLLGTPEKTAIQQEFAKRLFHTDDTWPASAESRVAVLDPDTYTLDLTVRIYHDATVQSSKIVADARQALTDYLSRTPIGGYSFPPGPEHILSLGDLFQVFEDIEGVQTVQFDGLSADIPLTPLDLVVEGTWTITPFPVAGT